MRLFRKLKKTDGWRALSFQENAVCAVHVTRQSSGKPQVKFALAPRISGSSEATLLDNLAKEWQGQRYQCTSLLKAGEYQFLPVDMPNVPPAELKSAISWLVKDVLDFSVDDATVDVLNIPQDKNAPQRNRAMYAVATRSRTIEQHQHRFEDAKIPLRVIDIPEMAQRNIAALVEAEGRAIALLSFNAEGGLLTITAGGELYLARRIDVTLEQLLLQSDPGQNVCHDRVALEIQRSLDHFGRQYQSMALSKLMLTPIAEEDGGLRAYLAENLDTPVETLNLETVFDFAATPELQRSETQQHYFLALGAALRLEEKVL